MTGRRRIRAWGLTGGIGSGKSTVAAMLVERGLPVFDADERSREATRPGGEAYDAVVRAFGPALVRPDGTLDRQAVADIVFADAERRRMLEAAVHPVVEAAAREWIAEQERAGRRICFYSAPLLLEAGHDRDMDGVVVVTCDEEVRVGRVAERDGVDPGRVRARIRAQMSDAERIRRATHVLPNDGTLEQLRARVETLVDTLCGA